MNKTSDSEDNRVALASRQCPAEARAGCPCHPRLADVLRVLLKIPALVLIGAVRLYQWLISPLLGRHCRFEPSCSAYFIESVQKYGALRGACRGVWRICRCNPWNPGGYDPP